MLVARHLFVNIMSIEYGRKEVQLCISHTSDDSTKSNENYFTLLLELKKEIFERYWELLRQPVGAKYKKTKKKI